ncbi:MAG: NAD(P)/FAD-dependent oxidoreductase [Bacteroidetes bacterium]|nr:NAD(P)/FAD-dependent oxidoreductase [Bacteroidota bacterium]
MSMKKAIIIGAGPAGLTAAYELLTRTDIKPVILEQSEVTGGISRTVWYKGNGMDIGGHRFFSKSDRVMDWWLTIMPMPEETTHNLRIAYRNESTLVQAPQKKQSGKTAIHMKVRNRLSRIYHDRKLFTYPLTLSIQTIRQLGFIKITRVFVSYVWARLFFHRTEKTLEDFFIRRFGNELYRTFFKDYTEKVWGVPCHEIPAEWGHQRIKKLSVTRALLHAGRQLIKKKRSGIRQKETDTSLIEQFLYPPKGPGQLWELVADRIREMGGEIIFHQQVDAVSVADENVMTISATNSKTGKKEVYTGDYFFSTMPVKDLIGSFEAPVPLPVRETAAGLLYRDFITVGMLLQNLKLSDTEKATIKDNWIYIQENDVKIGRLQIFNNWSPDLVQDPTHTWLGLEYFCNEGDALWCMSDMQFIDMAIDELCRIQIIAREDVLDSTVIRVEKTYPAYFGAYENFEVIKNYVNNIPNLFLIGRNGMHKYNNADHSMLTAMTAVDNIIEGRVCKKNIWEINTEQEYHETK